MFRHVEENDVSEVRERLTFNEMMTFLKHFGQWNTQKKRDSCFT